MYLVHAMTRSRQFLLLTALLSACTDTDVALRWPDGARLDPAELSPQLPTPVAEISPPIVRVGTLATCGLADPLAHLSPVEVTWRLRGAFIATGATLEVPDAVGQTLSCVATVWIGGQLSETEPTTARIAPRPGDDNVLVIVADDLGVDRVGVYGVGTDPPPTPNLDALAADGMRFNQAWATPSCSPTRAALLTGRHGFRTGIGKASSAADGYPLALDELTLPEVLAHAPTPYTSAAVGKWHLANFEVGHGHHVLEQGFLHHRGNLGNLRRDESVDGGVQGFFNYEYAVDGEVSRRADYLTSVEVDDALDFIATLPEPWLVYLAFHAAHSPAHVPPRDLYSGPDLVPGEASDQARFDAMTEALDTEIGRLLEGVPDTTLVVFLGDNGTEREAAQGPYPDDEVKLSMYEGGIRIPLIVRGPQVAFPGSTSDALVHVVDLLPTLAELAKLDVGATFPDLKLDGVSFAPYLADPTHPSVRQFVYTERFIDNGFGPYTEHSRAVRDARYKLIWDMTDGYELFDLGLRWQEEDDLLAYETVSDEASAAFEALAPLLEGPTFQR
jgi:arylsulfatase B